MNVYDEIKKMQREGKLSSSDAKGLLNFWKELEGEPYAKLMVGEPDDFATKASSEPDAKVEIVVKVETEAKEVETSSEDFDKVLASLTPGERKAYAAMTPEQKKELQSYYADLLPAEFANALVADYYPTGKVKQASKAADASFVEEFWGPIYGNGYANLMTDDYIQKKNIVK